MPPSSETLSRTGADGAAHLSEIRGLAITGFGGVPEPSLWEGVSHEPHFLASDMGSVDNGAYYLGSGKTAGATDRDIQLMLSAQQELGVPLLCGTAGMAGADVHLSQVADRIARIKRRRGFSFDLALIHAEIERSELHRWLDDGKVRPLGPVPALTHEQVDRCVRVVGQMGPEPYIRALEEGADVILGGRACDTSPYVALPMLRGFDTGLAFHMAKIIECVSLCADPGGRDCLLATLGEDSFVLESQAPNRRCTPVSVAAHSLYEQPNPYEMYEPGGMLDTSHCEYEAVSDRAVKVSGSEWVDAAQYTIKLEGASVMGYRAFSMAGVRDPFVIANLSEIEASVCAGIAEIYGPPGGDYRIQFRVYGRDGVLGASEPTPWAIPHEVFVLIDVVADTQKLAQAVCVQAKQNTMHCGFEGRKSTGGNIAFPFSPEVFLAGRVYEFNVYHLVEVDDPNELFRIEHVAA